MKEEHLKRRFKTQKDKNSLRSVDTNIDVNKNKQIAVTIQDTPANQMPLFKIAILVAKEPGMIKCFLDSLQVR